MQGAQGPEPHGKAQRSRIELDRVFFANGFRCRTECDPSDFNPVLFSAGVATTDFASALTVRDITDAAREQDVTATSPVRRAQFDTSPAKSIEDAGFDRQPPAHTYAYALDPKLESADGQTLGYPWVGVLENWHERPFTSFGTGHGVWESRGGAILPFYARSDLTRDTDLGAYYTVRRLPRIVALEKNDFEDLPPGNGTPRRLNVTPDATQSHGLDLTSVLTGGKALVWADQARNADPEVCPTTTRRSPRSCRSRTSASASGQPQSTLVFVTRLDNGEPVADARVSIVNLENKQLWRGATGKDGVVLARDAAARRRRLCELSFVVTAEKDGDVAYSRPTGTKASCPGTLDSRSRCSRRRTSCADRVHRPRRVNRRGSSRQGDCPCGYAERRAIAEDRIDARHPRDRRAQQGSRQAVGHDQQVGQRGVDVDGAGRRLTRQLLRHGVAAGH